MTSEINYRGQRELEIHLKEPLLQHGQLPSAPEINDPLNIPDNLLQSWLSYAKQRCDMNGYLCLAFTELSEEERFKLGFSKDLPPRVIYYRRSDQILETGALIINPLARENLEFGYNRPMIEGCGSIAYGQLGYFIKRPTVSSTTGYYYDGSSYSFKTFGSSGIDSGNSIHEITHLNGETAMDHPKELFDIRDANDWNKILEIVKPVENKEERFREVLKRAFPNGFLVYNRERKKFEVVDAHSNTLGGFDNDRYR